MLLFISDAAPFSFPPKKRNLANRMGRQFHQPKKANMNGAFKTISTQKLALPSASF